MTRDTNILLPYNVYAATTHVTLAETIAIWTQFNSNPASELIALARYGIDERTQATVAGNWRLHQRT